MKKITTRLLPRPKKILKRGVFETIKILEGKEVKPRDYGKRLREGRI